MSHRPFLKPLIILTIVTGALWVLFGYFGIQAVFVNKTIDEPIINLLPQAVPTPSDTDGTLSQTHLTGDFEQGDTTYTIRGKATIVRQHGSSTLILSDFNVTNGPDLFVYLVAASSTNNVEVKERVKQETFIQLAPLKGNRGNQTYQIPSDIDVSAYPVVSIWCRRFSRNFGSALLKY